MFTARCKFKCGISNKSTVSRRMFLHLHRSVGDISAHVLTLQFYLETREQRHKNVPSKPFVHVLVWSHSYDSSHIFRTMASIVSSIRGCSSLSRMRKITTVLISICRVQFGGDVLSLVGSEWSISAQRPAATRKPPAKKRSRMSNRRLKVSTENTVPQHSHQNWHYATYASYVHVGDSGMFEPKLDPF